MTEQQEQKQLLNWVKTQYKDLLYTEDMGGVRLTMSQAKSAKKTRCRKGHPDLMFQRLHWGSDDNLKYVGLAIEFKKKKCEPIQKKNGGLRKVAHLQEQHDYLMALRKQGWLACFCVGFIEAQKLIKAYMGSADDLEALEPFLFPKINRK
jgi:hypothetical protein